MSHVIALLACRNRRNRTIACLESLFAQDLQGVDLEAVLVDDGSIDGTVDAVVDLSENVEVIRGDGSLYWARSMSLAEERAMVRRPDFLLWLNDDVVLYPSAVRTLMSARDAARDARIVVGSTVDPKTGLVSYGGVRRIDWHPLRYKLVAPVDGEAQFCDTFNGNVALVPRKVYRAVGVIDGRFAHAFADFDYGLRARALGFEVAVAGGVVGECGHNPGVSWRAPSLSLVTRYRLMLGRKGVPIGSLARYLRRHGGTLWPIYIAATYAKVAGDHVRAKLVARTQRA
jgi:GT2 family glycosyltransferase